MKKGKGKDGDNSVAVTPEVVESSETELPSKITDEQTGLDKPKEGKQRLIRKWSDYNKILREKGLKPRHIKAIKAFIYQEFKTVSEWSKKCGIPHQTLSHWINHDQLFKGALTDLMEEGLDASIPFGLKAMNKRIRDGDETSLMRALGLRGRLGEQKGAKCTNILAIIEDWRVKE